MTMKVSCPVCGSGRLEVFLERRGVPVHQNLLVSTQAEAVAVARGDLAMTVCAECEFVFNAAFDSSLLTYGHNYDNTQTHSPHFATYVDELAILVNGNDLRDRRLVEVGCGKGYFLRKLVSLDAANTGVGFDPSYSGLESDLDDRIRFERRFYGPDCAVPADAVVCRHVIEHVEDPVALLQSVRGALDQSPAALVFFETPCVEWILQGGVVWDFFYEHCSLFSEHSLASAFAAAGFSVRRTRRLFGDQYLWLEAEPVADWRMRRCRGGVLELARRFASTEASIKHAIVAKLSDLGRNSGGIALWGAGAKGSTLANLADPERHIFDCVVDINPSKHGCFVPGTGHPIVDFRELPRRGVRHAVLTNPNYRSEINELLAQAEVNVTLLELETR